MYKVILILDKLFLKYEGGQFDRLPPSPEKNILKKPSLIRVKVAQIKETIMINWSHKNCHSKSLLQKEAPNICNNHPFRSKISPKSQRNLIEITLSHRCPSSDPQHTFRNATGFTKALHSKIKYLKEQLIKYSKQKSLY